MIMMEEDQVVGSNVYNVNLNRHFHLRCLFFLSILFFVFDGTLLFKHSSFLPFFFFDIIYVCIFHFIFFLTILPSFFFPPPKIIEEFIFFFYSYFLHF